MVGEVILVVHAAHFYEKLLCGEHSIKRYVNSYGTTKDFDDVYRRQLKNSEKRGDCICDYYSYRVLMSERTALSEDYKVLPKSKIFPFLQLPAEIRNRIYAHLFVLDQTIELCPDPFPFLGFKNKRMEVQNEAHYHAQNYQVKFFDTNVRSITPIMRLSKQLHREASPIFYGQNVFAFSNVAGWVCLDFFLHRIGLAKCGMIRKLIVCPPDHTVVPTSKSPVSYMKNGWFNDYTVTQDPTLILNKLGKLEKFGVTIPLFRAYSLPETLPIVLVKFDNLEVTLFSLDRDFPVRVRRGTFTYQVPVVDANAVAAKISTSVNNYPIRAVIAKVHDTGRYATGFIEDLDVAEEMAEIEREEFEIVAKRQFEIACLTPLPGDHRRRPANSR
ncbi:hypothetical protein CERZMDRAFT_99361 [Cercospora zeae-maydis SCOH1-5]|uniref:F-box domain-containing protein n=1 Tax=Cercospora zeae-maydis SCOH1-5 TaxID=717836 RepID=A0A6A6FBC8_9PEZI|nr:hypothetical protein CERZMDRAFT_99361 [Cercospora zeae-maydis SCOH1-5]